MSATAAERVTEIGRQRAAQGPSTAATPEQPLETSPSSHARHSSHSATDSSASRSALSTRLLTQAASETDPVERKRLQDEVVVMHMGLARAIAARYRGRGMAEEDLTQAAAMALLKAARNFDPSHGVEFLSYAVVTMKGEVKRQFRDFGWMVRPPRPIQKLQADVAHAQSELIQTLGRSPRVPEVAAHLGVSEEEVLEALTADGCFTPTSLDLPLGDDGSSTTLGDTLTHEDPALDEAEARVMLMPAVRALPERERQVLYLRFFRQMSQSQIAAEVGVTQMQVSRILSRVLGQLRGQLEGA
jgi:RNA polymerase sigma-B factor